MPLVTQNEYCNIHGQNPAWGSRLRAKDRLKLVEDPAGTIDPKTKKVRILVDSDATDLMNGFAQLVITKQTPNSDATKKDPAPLPSNKTVENTTLLEAQRAKTFYEAETKKFELAILQTKYILKSEALSQINEIASLVKSSVDNLKFHFKNNYDAKVAKKVSDDMDNMIKKLAGLNDE